MKLIAEGAAKVGKKACLPEAPQSELAKSHSFTLPFPPTVNTYYRHVGAKVLISAKGRKYRKDVAAALIGRRTMGNQRLMVIIRVFPPDRRKRDLDNLLKSSLDAIKYAGLFDDDEQIDRITIARGQEVAGGLLSVELIAIDRKDGNK